MTARAEHEAEAARLLEQGIAPSEIAERMGVGRTTVYDWLNDPGGHRLAARKRSYAGECVDCGAPTDGSDGPLAGPSTRCRRCNIDLAHAERQWTPETVLAALEDIENILGRPFLITDVNPRLITDAGRRAQMIALHAERRWPTQGAVDRELGARVGTWRAALAEWRAA